MAILSKEIYMVNAISIKIPTTFVGEIEKAIPKVHWEAQKTINS
jgi:hypothetical protein